MAIRMPFHRDGALRAALTAVLALGPAAGAAADRVASSPPDVTASVTVLVRGQPLTLDLEPRALRVPSFEVRVQDGAGWRGAAPPAASTVRGTVRGQVGAVAGGSLQGDRLIAALRLADGTIWFVQPAAEPGLHQVTALEELPAGSWLCGAPAGFARAGPGGAGGGAASGGALEVATLAFDCDVEFYQLHGSSVSSTVSDIETIMAMVTAIYEAEVAISYQIGTVIVRTVEPDPYQATNHVQLLGELSAHWNASQQGVIRDAAHLMTGKDLDGGYIGAAAQGVICSSPTGAYGLSQSLYTNNFGLRFALTAHELGHNWGAGHCASECDGTPGDPDCAIMCPCIGGCTGNLAAFGAAATAQIVAHRDAVTCGGADPPCPADLDGSGAVDVQDMVALVLAWGGSSADLTGDGLVNVQDLVALVLAWGAC